MTVSKHDNDQREVDELSGTATTGHEWDGIKELDTPMPRWWLWTFYATILFSIGYVIYYPAIPLINGSTMGISGYTNRAELQKEMALATQAKQKFVEQINAATVDQIAQNPDLARFATAAGASLFKVHCVQCHGSGAQGAPGYPNLNDDDWLWGGTLDAIHTTIQDGVRSPDDDNTRISEMPAFGRDGILDATAINNVADYVLKISGQESDEKAAEAGKAVFAANCASCHGAEGKGDQTLGAPNLTDQLWLYGSSKSEIVTQITTPRMGVMPAWGPKLGPTAVKELTVYIHNLGGGQ